MAFGAFDDDFNQSLKELQLNPVSEICKTSGAENRSSIALQIGVEYLELSSATSLTN
jgi:hypothetical protein